MPLGEAWHAKTSQPRQPEPGFRLNVAKVLCHRQAISGFGIAAGLPFYLAFGVAVPHPLSARTVGHQRHTCRPPRVGS